MRASRTPAWLSTMLAGSWGSVTKVVGHRLQPQHLRLLHERRVTG